MSKSNLNLYGTLGNCRRSTETEKEKYVIKTITSAGLDFMQYKNTDTKMTNNNITILRDKKTRCFALSFFFIFIIFWFIYFCIVCLIS